jgi:hypothetical protein
VTPNSLCVCCTDVSRASLIPRISSGSNIRWNLGPSVSNPEASDAEEPSVPLAPVAPKVPTPPLAAVEPCRGGQARNPVIWLGNAYGNMPPAEAQRVKTKEWRSMTSDMEAMQPLVPAPGRAGQVPKPAEPPVLPTEPWSPVTERIRKHVCAVTTSAAAPSCPGMITVNSIVRTRSKGLREIPQSKTRDTSASNQTNNVTKMAHEGGEGIVRYLMAMSASDSKPVRKWTHCGVLALPYAEGQKWLGPDGAYWKELEALQECNVFGPLVDLPKGKKVIRTRWGLNIKSDGCMRACLVGKGFMQREGVNFNEVFSPVVCFETVHIHLALAVLED